MKRSTSQLLFPPPVLPPGMARGMRYIPSAFVSLPGGRGDKEKQQKIWMFQFPAVRSFFTAKNDRFRIFPKFLLNPVENNTIIKTKTTAVGR